MQVIDVRNLHGDRIARPRARAVLHMEFTTTGNEVWISARDDNRIVVYDTSTFAAVSPTLPADSPIGHLLHSARGEDRLHDAELRLQRAPRRASSAAFPLVSDAVRA